MKSHENTSAHRPARRPQLRTLFKLIDDPEPEIYSIISPLIVARGEKAQTYIQNARNVFSNNPIVIKRCNELEASINLQPTEVVCKTKRSVIPAMREAVAMVGGSRNAMKLLGQAVYTYSPPIQTDDSFSYKGMISSGILSTCFTVLVHLQCAEYTNDRTEEYSNYDKESIDTRAQYNFHCNKVGMLVDAICEHIRANLKEKK
jgi:hypothetical protein